MTSTAMPARRPGPGRPRDETKTPQILQAVLDLIAEVGYQALRVEVVAARAGVSLGSVYRRWPTKQDLVIAALDSSPSAIAQDGAIELGRSGDADSDLSTLLMSLAQRLSEPRHSHLALLAAEPNEPEVATAARRQIPPVRRYLRSLFADRVGAEHPALELLVDMGPALVWYRTLVTGERIDAPALVGELKRYLIDPIVASGPRGPEAGAVVGGGETPDDAEAREDAMRLRHRIVTAATQLFDERTYQEVRLADVAARAGVSRADLARLVGTKHTKQQLRVEVHKQRLRDLLLLCARALAEPDPWRGVEVLVRTGAAWAEGGDGSLLGSLDRSDPAAPDEEWLLLVGRTFAALDEVLDRAKEDGSLRPTVTSKDILSFVSPSVAAGRIAGVDPSLYLEVLLQGLHAADPGHPG